MYGPCSIGVLKVFFSFRIDTVLIFDIGVPETSICYDVLTDLSVVLKQCSLEGMRNVVHNESSLFIVAPLRVRVNPLAY